MLPTKRALLYVGGMVGAFGEMKYKKDFKNYDNKIVECKMDLERKTWEFMRERTDKAFPNAYTTAVGKSSRLPPKEFF